MCWFDIGTKKHPQRGAVGYAFGFVSETIKTVFNTACRSSTVCSSLSIVLLNVVKRPCSWFNSSCVMVCVCLNLGARYKELSIQPKLSCIKKDPPTFRRASLIKQKLHYFLSKKETQSGVMPTTQSTIPGQDRPFSCICQRASSTIAPPMVRFADHLRKLPFSRKIWDTSKAIAIASQGFTFLSTCSSFRRLLLRSTCSRPGVPVQ